MKLAVRAAAVGMDPWRVLLPGADPTEHLLAEALVEQLEANAVAKAEVQANLTAYRVIEGALSVLEQLGVIERRRG